MQCVELITVTNMYVNHSFGHTAFNVYTKSMKKKILTTIIVILILVGGGYIYTKYFTYTPNYQRVSQVLRYPQKEISFEVDVDKWRYLSGIDDFLGGGESSGINIFFKDSFNEKWSSTDGSYIISFDYQYRPGSEKYCEEEGMGDYCGPQHPYGHPHPDATIIEVQGIPLAVPVYLEEESRLNDIVVQLVPEEDNQILDRMNFLNNPPMVSDSDQDFRIHPENPYDKKFWEKEVKPALIHALETFEIKDVKKPE